MAIQNRRGSYDDLDPSKLLAGEWAIATSNDTNAADGMGCYMCFKPGTVKRMATYEDMVQNVSEASAEVVSREVDKQCKAAIKSCNNATDSANTAVNKANEATANAIEVTDDAKEAADRANEAAESIEQMNVKPFAFSLQGKNIRINNSASKPVIGFGLYGFTEQDGTPSLEQPAEFYMSGQEGRIITTFTDGSSSQTLSLSTPDGLAGIKVDAGGNYIDENNQHWICDEIKRNERGTGKFIKRIGRAKVSDCILTMSTLENNNNVLKISGITDKSDEMLGGMFTMCPVEQGVSPEEMTIGSAYETEEGFNIIGSKYDTPSSLMENYMDCEFIYVLNEAEESELSTSEIQKLTELYTYYPSTTISNNVNCGMDITYITKYYQGTGDSFFYGVSKDTNTRTAGINVLDAYVAHELNGRISNIESTLTQTEQGMFEIDGGLKVCWGRLLLSYQNINICMSSVYFPTIYDELPFVFVSLVKENTSTQLEWNPYIVRNSLTTDHCTFACGSQSGNFSSDFSPTVFWVAIGY